MPRDMLCYCLNLSYEDGYFKRPSEHHPGLYCTSCKGDLAWFLNRLAEEESAAGSPPVPARAERG
jgi:hypothetical protein